MFCAVHGEHVSGQHCVCQDRAEASLRETCTRDLKAAAAVLEAAVGTVAKAAEDKEPRPPSKHLVAVCCDAVCALLRACVSGSAVQ